jgi:hypothetical protein
MYNAVVQPPHSFHSSLKTFPVLKALHILSYLQQCTGTLPTKTYSLVSILEHNNSLSKMLLAVKQGQVYSYRQEYVVIPKTLASVLVPYTCVTCFFRITSPRIGDGNLPRSIYLHAAQK